MARSLKTTKDKLVQLLNVTDQVPATKIASDIGKHLGFRKALKKQLEGYLDAKAAAVEKVREKQKGIVEKLQKLDAEIAPLTDEAVKAPLVAKKSKLEEELQTFVAGQNAELDKLTEALKGEKVEVTFDNEDATFEKIAIKENATTIFKMGQDRFNADHAEIVFDILDAIE